MSPSLFFLRKAWWENGLMNVKLNWCKDYEFWFGLGKEVALLKIPHKITNSCFLLIIKPQMPR